MTVLVTGGAGYIGSHTVLALAEAGQEVVVIDNLSTGFSSALPAGVPLFIGDVSDENLVEGVIAVLAEWRPAPDGILGFASHTHPMLVGSLVGGLSRHLGVPVVGEVQIVDDSIAPGQGATNSAQRIAAVSRRTHVGHDDVTDRRLLLVDDLVVTGWSMTIAAHRLRQAGADTVLPLALGLQT